MFYLLRKNAPDLVEVGERVMVLADFSGIPAGTKGIVTENYKSGVSVTWEKDGKTAEDIRAAMEGENEMALSGARGFTIDGFWADELEYLAFETQTHPWKGTRSPDADKENES